MSPFSVVPNLNVFKDFQFHLFFRNQFVPINQFSFQGFKEALSYSIILTIPSTAHTSCYFFIGIKNIYKLFASILDTSVGMENQTFFNISVFNRHFTSFKRGLICTHSIAQTPAYNFSIIQTHNSRQIYKSFFGLDVSNLS